MFVRPRQRRRPNICNRWSDGRLRHASTVQFYVQRCGIQRNCLEQYKTLLWSRRRFRLRQLGLWLKSLVERAEEDKRVWVRRRYG